MTPARKHQRGFTLIELMVVVAMIVAAALLVGPRFRANDGASLREAESTVAGVLRIARASAVMKATRARVVISADSSSNDNYLTLVAVVVKSSSGTWTLAAPPWKLPTPVKVVPESPPPTVNGVVWPATAISVFSGTESLAVDGLAGGSYHYLEFTETGGTMNGRKILLSLSSRGSDSALFNAPDQVRAFIMRASGLYTLVKEPASL